MKFVNRLVKWILIIMAGLSAALVSIFFLSNNSALNLFSLRLITLAAVGFIGGLAGRILFKRLHAFWTLLLVWAANLISISVIDLLYSSPYQLDFLTGRLDFSEFSISDGSQLVFMVLVSLLPVLFMRRKAHPAVEKPARKPGKKSLSSRKSLKPILYRMNPQNWQVFQFERKAGKEKPRKAAKPKVAPQPKPTAKIAIPRPTKERPVTRIKANNGRKPAKVKAAVKRLKMPAKLFIGNENDVKLVGEEEHVCPYCLEEVVKGDKNGVVVCPECGTWHHQDCWNLTGACGVAHRNEL